MIRTRVLERDRRGFLVDLRWWVGEVGDSRRVGSGKIDSVTEVLQELLRERVFCIWPVQRDAIHPRKAFSLLHVRLRFCSIHVTFEQHSELSGGFGR